MAAPTITATPNKPGPYIPGENITISWVVIDADNSTEVLNLTGVDSQGNVVNLTLDITRRDIFTMTRVWWPRTGVDLVIDNVNQRAVGTVPSAAA